MPKDPCKMMDRRKTCGWTDAYTGRPVGEDSKEA